ncbi:MAG: hypothetical protein ACE5GM_06905, partial [bacterium]
MSEALPQLWITGGGASRIRVPRQSLGTRGEGVFSLPGSCLGVYMSEALPQLWITGGGASRIRV